jgi:23S rRNA (adenine2503-C2)-methyltransferase
MDACHYYIEKTGRRLTFEWALISGENDTIEQARALGNLLRGMLCHVNLIPLNPTAGFSGGPFLQRARRGVPGRTKPLWRQQHGTRAARH